MAVMSDQNHAQWIRIPALSDNYVWILHNPASGDVAIIDPGEAAPIIAVLEQRRLIPSEIINTHHHDDHTLGNAELMEKYDIPLIAPLAEAEYIADVTRTISPDDVFTIAGYEAQAIATPGHTLGHLAYYLADCFGEHGVAFVGDNLFSLGCGRVFEGSMEQMWSSLLALRALPDDTLICCGHEYSAGNADYVESLNWPRPEAKHRIAEIRNQRKRGEATLPVRLGDEKSANPFLNCDAEDLAQALGLGGHSPLEVFTALREGKDVFAQS